MGSKEIMKKYEEQTIKKPPLSRSMGGIPRELLSTGIKGKVPKLCIIIFANRT
jgi:hypothetical protein